MTDDERAIRNLVETWMEASKAGDVATVLSLMSDDAVFMVPGREPFGKEAFAAASAGQSEMRIDGRSEIRELQVLGDWAYLRAYIDITVTPPVGQLVRRAGWTLTILRKQPDGRWLLTRDANLLTVQPDGIR
ncbi:SgcJ/EcaC family oxidoreductase [Inquilinus limosus]|uniref:YybH family protein n=1 Tax=Inquilinus limosus TaxID=171674 RepID=UPI003F172958